MMPDEDPRGEWEEAMCNCDAHRSHRKHYGRAGRGSRSVAGFSWTGEFSGAGEFTGPGGSGGPSGSGGGGPAGEGGPEWCGSGGKMTAVSAIKLGGTPPPRA